jgi:hypothetical protein
MVRLFATLLALVGLWVMAGTVAMAEQPRTAAAGSSVEVVQGFTAITAEEAKLSGVADKKKHLILFSMGVALIVGVLLTASLGIAMVILNKPVFVAHMVSAGFTVFLALAHAVAAIVWFSPF